MDRKEQIKNTVSAFFPECGVCRLTDIPRRLPFSRADELPEAGSVLALLLPYYCAPFPQRNLALYAVPDDYHELSCARLTAAAQALSRLFPENRWLHFCDRSPLPEVDTAILAGLGVRGDNNLLISPRYGSFCFIAEIVTDLVLEPDIPVGDACEQCSACRRACPTGALSKSGFDPARCRSAISQKKGALSDWERGQLAAGGFVWGCDLCLLACPHNRDPRQTPVREFCENTDDRITAENLTSLLPRKSWGWRGEAVLRRNLAILAGEEAQP